MEPTSVTAFLEYFERVHTRTRAVVRCVTPEVLEWRAAPGRWTPGEIIRHLAAIERYMYAETVHDRPCTYCGNLDELAGNLEATVAVYDLLHAESRQLFSELTDDRLTAKCLTPAGTPITVGKWLRAMIEHEAHHRGQLYFILGMCGVSTPPIFGLTSEELRARVSRTD